MQKNPIIQFIKHWKKYGFKQTYKDWKLNFYIIQTSELINKQQIQGSAAMMLGLFVILCIFIKQGMYYGILAILAGLFLNYISLKQFILQRRALKNIKENFVEVGE